MMAPIKFVLLVKSMPRVARDLEVPFGSSGECLLID
jgi:hypothetical protein